MSEYEAMSDNALELRVFHRWNELRTTVDYQEKRIATLEAQLAASKMAYEDLEKAAKGYADALNEVAEGRVTCPECEGKTLVQIPARYNGGAVTCPTTHAPCPLCIKTPGSVTAQQLFEKLQELRDKLEDARQCANNADARTEKAEEALKKVRIEYTKLREENERLRKLSNLTPHMSPPPPFDDEWVMVKTEKLFALAEALEASDEIDEQKAELEAIAKQRDGHEQPCYYCGEPCDRLAGNPGKWPVALCHKDDPGKVKWHHTGCVSERLEQLTQRDERIAELENRIAGDMAFDRLRKQIRVGHFTEVNNPQATLIRFGELEADSLRIIKGEQP